MTNQFLSDLFGEQEGYIYSPTKEGGWTKHFFKWPHDRARIETHLAKYNETDVYISPVLFNKPEISPESFKGSYHLWTEFDGVIPKEVQDKPTMRIMSSKEGHEHWYWKLDKFVTDKVLLEDLTRRIAYHYGADLSAWDYQQVLRPVDTWNHKRNKPVTLVEKNDNVYSVDRFLWIPIPPAGTRVDVSMGQLPPREEVLAKYKWKIDTLDLLFKDDIPQGKRSDALARVAFDAVEVGCSNEEVFVLLEERDRVWGKYLGRTDRVKRLEATIAHVRSKKLAVAEVNLDKAAEVYRFADFMNTNIRLKWAIPGLLPVAGSMVLLGKEGLGKSTFLLRMAMELALGSEFFLNWQITNNQKVLFVSLEMQHGELKEFFLDMKIPPELWERLQEQFIIWPIGHAYPFDVPDQQPELLKWIDTHKIDLVIIDSLGLSMYGSVTNDDDVKRLNAFMNEDLRKDRNCGYIFIHHLRKKTTGEERKITDLDDSFGSRYITANAQTVVLLSQRPSSSRLNVKLLKTRMTIGSRDFDIERTSDRGFKLVGSISSNEAPSVIEGEVKSEQATDAKSLGKLFTL
jgi:hypothetical protein